MVLFFFKRGFFNPDFVCISGFSIYHSSQLLIRSQASLCCFTENQIKLCTTRKHSQRQNLRQASKCMLHFCSTCGTTDNQGDKVTDRERIRKKDTTITAMQYTYCCRLNFEGIFMFHIILLLHCIEAIFTSQYK